MKSLIVGFTLTWLTGVVADGAGGVVAAAERQRGSDRREARFDHFARMLDDLPLPAAWAGYWTFDFTERDCDDLSLIGTFSEGPYLLCQGEPFDDTLTCTGTFGDDSADITCTGVESLPGCTLTEEIHFMATRNGDAASYMLVENLTYNGGECPEPSICRRYEVQMTRTAPPPVPCTTAVENLRWHAVKQLFR